jgi:hypothetical protein
MSRHAASSDSTWRLISRADVFARATTAHDDMFLLAVLDGPVAAKDARNKGIRWCEKQARAMGIRRHRESDVRTRSGHPPDLEPPVAALDHPCLLAERPLQGRVAFPWSGRQSLYPKKSPGDA